MDAFWILDPYILIKHYDEVIPNKNMTMEQQLNAITRLIIYYIILIIIFYKNTGMVIYGLIIIGLLVAFYYLDKDDEHFETLEDIKKIPCDSCQIDRNTVFDNPISNEENNNSNNLLESGYIDSDGNYKIGPEYTPYTEKLLGTVIKNNNNNNNQRVPSTANPYANIVFSDYLDLGNIPEPCNVDDTQIQTDMQNLYNSSIYRNTSDVYERENSQRMFYTTTVLDVPNGQSDFANWCFKAPTTCKENTGACTYYDQSLMQSPRY